MKSTNFLKAISTIIFTIMLFASPVKADTIQVANHIFCASTQVIIPVRVWGFDSVASFAQQLHYDKTVLQYTGFQNSPSNFVNMVNSTSNQGNDTATLSMAGFSLNNVIIPDSGILVELIFNYSGGYSYLNWDIPFNPPASFYSDGSVNASTGPNITSQPPSTVTVYASNNTTLSIVASSNGGLFYQWQYATTVSGPWANIIQGAVFNNVNTPNLDINSVPQSYNGYLFRCEITGLCTQVYTNPTTLNVVALALINGQLTYDNAYNTPITNTTINLLLNGSISQTTTTDSSGNFSFTGVANGTYTINAVITKVHGGLNSSDALLAITEFVHPGTLQGLRLIAADVDLSGVINAMDALRILKRFVNMINSFPSGDWYSESPVIQVSSGNTYTPIIKAICFGDLNGTYNPPL